MGANLCSFRRPRTIDDHDQHKDEPKDNIARVINQSSPSNVPINCSAILIRRPMCLDQTTVHRKKRTRNSLSIPAEKKSSKTRKLISLEEWLKDSPGTSNYNYSSRKVYPSLSSSSSNNNNNNNVCSRSRSCFHSRSSINATLASRAIRDSITLEPVAKSGSGIAMNGYNSVVEIGESGSSLSKSKSVKLVKKVSFKEELDMIFIYSAEEASTLE